jgi:hypothetical protein
MCHSLVLDNRREDKRRRNHERQPGLPSPLRRKEAALEAEQVVACVGSAVGGVEVEGTFACIVCRCMAIMQLVAKSKYRLKQLDINSATYKLEQPQRPCCA